MNEVIRRAHSHVLKIEALNDQLKEIENFIASAKSKVIDEDGNARDDIEIGILTARESPHRRDPGFHRVTLGQDFGVFNIQQTILNAILAELDRRKIVIEQELNKLIGAENN